MHTDATHPSRQEHLLMTNIRFALAKLEVFKQETQKIIVSEMLTFQNVYWLLTSSVWSLHSVLIEFLIIQF